MSTITPLEIRRTDTSGLKIQWSDGTSAAISSDQLRRNCPCALCKAARGDTSHDKPLGSPKKSSLLKVIEHSKDEELRLEEVWAIGQYAIGLRWGDKHDTGIYTYQYLYQLGSSPVRD